MGPIIGKMTSSTKPEIYNLPIRRQRRIEPWPQATCVENYVRFDVWSLGYARGQTHRQAPPADTPITILRFLNGAE